MRHELSAFLLLTALVAPAFGATQAEFDTMPLPLLAAPSLSFDREPGGREPAWQATGSRPSDYRIGMASIPGSVEAKAGAILALPNASAQHDGGMGQRVDATDYRGQRVRLSARLKSQDVSAVQLWLRLNRASRALPTASGLRVPGPNRTQSTLYNLADGPVKGTTDWRRYEIVLDVSGDAVSLDYGFGIVSGEGAAFGDSFTLEKVGRDVALTLPTPRMLYGVPENLFGTINGHLPPK